MKRGQSDDSTEAVIWGIQRNTLTTNVPTTPTFRRNGAVLTEDERAQIGRRMGLCLSCGNIKTHKTTNPLKMVPIKDNNDVHQGKCVKCNQDSVPPCALALWKEHQKEKNAPRRKSVAVRKAVRFPQTDRRASFPGAKATQATPSSAKTKLKVASFPRDKAAEAVPSPAKTSSKVDKDPSAREIVDSLLFCVPYGWAEGKAATKDEIEADKDFLCESRLALRKGVSTASNKSGKKEGLEAKILNDFLERVVDHLEESGRQTHSRIKEAPGMIVLTLRVGNSHKVGPHPVVPNSEFLTMLLDGIDNLHQDLIQGERRAKNHFIQKSLALGGSWPGSICVLLHAEKPVTQSLVDLWTGSGYELDLGNGLVLEGIAALFSVKPEAASHKIEAGELKEKSFGDDLGEEILYAMIRQVGSSLQSVLLGMRSNDPRCWYEEEGKPSQFTIYKENASDEFSFLIPASQPCLDLFLEGDSAYWCCHIPASETDPTPPPAASDGDGRRDQASQRIQLPSLLSSPAPNPHVVKRGPLKAAKTASTYLVPISGSSFFTHDESDSSYGSDEEAIKLLSIQEDNGQNTNATQEQQLDRGHRRPYDLVEAAGSPANPIDFPEPRIRHGRRRKVHCYNPRTQGHEMATNVLFHQECGEAYWPMPFKAPIQTIMGHVEICIVLSKRTIKDKGNSSSEEDEDKEEIVFEITEELVAVKVNYSHRMEELRHKHCEDPLKEIAAMEIIGGSHPNVMGFRAVLFDGQALNVVMPYCRSGDLFQLIQNSVSNDQTPGMTESQARYWFRQVLAGLKHIHSVGVCHRDLSPENIMMDGSGCLIIDMGMAIRMPYTDPNNPASVVGRGRGTHRRLILPQRPCGKLPYMSPEIYASKLPFDGSAVDVWTCGTILFCMLTGYPSYKRPHSSDPQFYWMTQGLPQVLAGWNVYLSSEGLHLLENMLQIDPRMRLSLEEIEQHPWFAHQDEPQDANDIEFQL